MKILVASSPIPGHLNPLLSVARLLAGRGDEVLVQTATALRGMVAASGLDFVALRPGADLDLRRIDELFPGRGSLQGGPELLLFDFRNVFVGTVPDQAEGLREQIGRFGPDLVLSDVLFCGTMPMLLGSTPRPPVAAYNISFLQSERDDHAPVGLGLPPARDEAARAEYARIRAGAETAFLQPVQRAMDACLAGLGVGALPIRLMDALTQLPDLCLQPTVPGFEYPRAVMPRRLHFIGALPLPPSPVGMPGWWGEIDDSRPVALVTQGTVANADLGRLVAPTLAALAEEDVQVIVTTGGRTIDAVPGTIPANARLAEYLPFAEVLPHVDVLVTNGGYGSINLALAHGIPVVAAGRTEDKIEVGARVAWAGIGLDLQTDTPGAADVRVAVMRVLREPQFRDRARRFAFDFAAHDAAAEALSLLDGIVERRRQAA